MSTIKSRLRAEAKRLRSEYNNFIACEEAFIKSDFYKNNDTLLLYSSFGTEADTLKLINKALFDGKKVFLPKVNNDDLLFYQVTDLSRMHNGSFGIMEPVVGKFYDGVKAVCVVPGLAFDSYGNRLGYGKGFYDRFLSQNPNLIKIGFCLGCCYFENIPVSDNDISMEYLFIDDSLVSI